MSVTNKGSMKIKVPQRSLTYNAENSYVSSSTDTSFYSQTALTVTAWIRPTTTESEGVVCNGTNVSSYNYFLGLDSNRKVYSAVKTGGNTSSVTSDNAIPLNVWSHIAMRFDVGTSLDVIINGTDITESTPTYAIGSVAYPLYIGAYGCAAFAFEYTGDICDVQIFSGTCLTDTQIEQVYNGLDLSPTFHWKFNGAEKPDYVKDYGTIGKHAYISGAVWTTRDIRCWNTRWDCGNYDHTIETFMSPCDRNFLFRNVVPGAVAELFKVLGQPYYIDTTYSSSNSLKIECLSGYGLSSLRESVTIGVKSISDSFLNKDLYSVKIEGIELSEL